uniref:Uncharacterized protein n=1 Tax=Romanomermis culicivorax TaxID=13658 RepID=A0A915JZ18_ROMCU
MDKNIDYNENYNTKKNKRLSNVNQKKILNSPRQTYLSYLASGITLDVIDSVLFLQLLIDPELKDSSKKHTFLPGAIIFFACFNFVLPTFALFKLRYTRRLPHWMPLPYEKLYTLFYFLTVNLPFLIIRAYVWQKDKNDVSIFIVKNFVMVILAFREVWVSYLQWKENGGYFTKKHNKNDDSSASSNSNQVNQAYYGGDNPRNNKVGDNVCSL